MTCSRAAWVEQFIAGRLPAHSIPAMEAHIEDCEECFLRVAAASGEVSPNDRRSLYARSSSGSRLHRCLESLSASDTIPDLQGMYSVTESSPREIGPYLVTGLLGLGGMSAVYRARHPGTGREVAVKTPKMPQLASSVAMLRQEIEFLREAQHPAIVTVLDSDLMADDPWYAMELFEGPTMQEFNRRLWSRSSRNDLQPATDVPSRAAGGQLADVLRLYSRLCEPVGFIHGAGMVHGDIKPANVFIRDEQPVLMDFGLASRARGGVGREALDVTGRIRGTLPYMAPEIIRGQIPDARADLYAMGCMLYESIVGTPPFVSTSGTKIIDMHLSVAPTRASDRVAGVPAELDELLRRLLAKSPRERFGHASALGSSLAAIAESLSGNATARARVVVSSGLTMPLFRPPMVGREGELETVLECLRQANASSSGAMLLVAGESGIGKTFFAAEVAQRAILAGAHVITGDCASLAVADAGGTPFQAFRRFFHALRDRCHEHGRTEVDRLFGARLEILANYVPILRHLRRAGERQEPLPPLPASAARERIVSAVVDTIAAYAVGRRVLLAIDDLQWADDLSLAVLDRLDDDLFAKVPLVVMGTYRSDEAGDVIRRLTLKSWTQSLELGRLGRSDVDRLVAGMLSMTAPPELLVDYVHLNAEGVPFFAAEYLRALVAAGALVYQDGAWTARAAELQRSPGPGETPLPRTLQELIRGRLNRLAPEIVEMLEVGAVVGRRFSAALIGRIVDRPVGDVAPLLAGTSAAQITESDGFDGYTFLHDKIRETLYAGLAPERRARLHLEVALAMEEDHPTPDRHGLIGHHFLDAGRPAMAVSYLEKAGEHALSIAANAEAARFFREVLDVEVELSPRLPVLRRARWLRLRGDALQGLGMAAESAEALKASAALLGRPFPTNKAGFAFQLARETLIQFWHRLRPRSIRRPRQAQVEVNAEIVRIFERMHEVSFYLGHDADLVLSTTVSLNASERAGATPSLAVAYSNAAMMAGVLPLPKLAERYFRLADEAIETAPDHAAESWLKEMEGHFRVWQGKRERAIACLEQAITLARGGGFFRRADEAECVRIGLDAYAGLHSPVLARADVVERGARKRHDSQVQCWVILQKVEALLIRRDLETARAEVARATALLPALGRPERIWATGLDAYVRYEMGEIESARELLERGITLVLHGPPIHSYCLSPCARLAEIAIAMCRTARSKPEIRARAALANRACQILERSTRVFSIAQPIAALHRGTLDIVLRRRPVEVVVRRWRAAVTVARELALPYHELRLLLVILARTNERDPAWAEGRRRLRELAEQLDLRAADLDLPSDGQSVSAGGIEIEGKREQPLA